MDWVFELWDLFSAKTLEEKLNWLATTAVPIVVFASSAIYAVFAVCARKWPFRRDISKKINTEKPASPNPVQDITTSVPDNKPIRTEGDFVGAFYDLPDDQKQTLLETLNRISPTMAKPSLEQEPEKKSELKKMPEAESKP